MLKTLVAIALSVGLVFLYTWIVGQEGSLVESGNERSKVLYAGSALGIAYLIYRLIFDKLWKDKKGPKS